MKLDDVLEKKMTISIDQISMAKSTTNHLIQKPFADMQSIRIKFKIKFHVFEHYSFIHVIFLLSSLNLRLAISMNIQHKN